MKKVNKKFFLLLILYFFLYKLRGFFVVKNRAHAKTLVYNVLIYFIVTPKMLLNLATIWSALFFLVENSK